MMEEERGEKREKRGKMEEKNSRWIKSFKP
jgi:hypothetical protein